VCDRETRGSTFGFTKTVTTSQGKPLQLVAAGHNAKLPMLVIATASTMIPSKPRVKTWRVTDAQGNTLVYSRTTDQTQVRRRQSTRAPALSLSHAPLSADARDVP
jgi:hypothetical protein